MNFRTANSTKGLNKVLLLLSSESPLRTSATATESDGDGDNLSMRPSQLHFSSSRGRCPLMTLLLLVSIEAILSSPTFVTSTDIIDPSSTLECHRREYSYKVIRADSLGRKCWDHITVMSCWGRCDSNEVADWQFPYKLPHHPVCMHDQRVLRTTELANCEPEVELGTNIYEYYEAVTCTCQICQSSFANCEGLHYRADNLI